jgi:hypothetical protein
MESEDDIVLREAQTPTIRPAQAIFILQQGLDAGRPLRYRVQISDPIGSVRNWQATWDQDWLRLRTNRDGVSGGIYLVLTDSASLLSPGVYTATVTFTGSDTQVRLPVRLFVSAKIWSFFLPLVERE